MKLFELCKKAIELIDLEDASKAIGLFKRLMDLSHQITGPEHPTDGAGVEEFNKIKQELLKESKFAIAKAYQVNTKIPPTTDTNIVAHYYDDAMQYIEKLGFNIDLPRLKGNVTEEMGKAEGRCWEGYEPVAGMKPYEKGSCQKK